MDRAAVILKRLTEQVLTSDGSVPLALLLECLSAVADLRSLAQKLGLSPKGGFRVERAPAKVLAPLLAEQRDAKSLHEVFELLLPKAQPAESPDAESMREQAGEVAEQRALLALRDADVARLREETERARESQNRARASEVEIERELSSAQEQLARAKRELHEAAHRPSEAPSPRDDRDLANRLHELEAEREGLLVSEQALRRQMAREHSRTRELEDEVAELESLIPASRRRKKKPMSPEPELERRVLVPHFLPSFYKSLEGKDRRSVERAVQAVLLFCTEGHAYPGLETKQLGGQDMWSMRASLGLRIYFRPISEGDIEVLELGDREDQNTTLRRLKEK